MCQRIAGAHDYPRFHFVVRYPNLRYGDPIEFAYYATGAPLADLARRLRRDERAVRNWLARRICVPC